MDAMKLRTAPTRASTIYRWVLWSCVLLVHVLFGGTAYIRSVLTRTSSRRAHLFRHWRRVFDLFLVLAGYIHPRLLRLLFSLCSHNYSVTYRCNRAIQVQGGVTSAHVLCWLLDRTSAQGFQAAATPLAWLHSPRMSIELLAPRGQRARS
jgi:hypothetical protein